MKRFFLLFSLMLLPLLSSCDFSAMIYKEVPFPSKVMEADGDEEVITFLVLSDQHLGSEENARHYEDVLFEILDREGKTYPFAIINGDLVHSPASFKKATAFISRLNPYVHNNSIYVIGNHEVQRGDRKAWLEYDFNDFDRSLYARYTYSGVSIYKLDTADRTVGISQLRAFEKALDNDENEYKIIFSHVPISGSPLEATAYQFTLPDADERNHLIALMKKYNVGIYIGGHHHKGNRAEDYGDNTSGFVLASGYRKEFMNLDGDGWFYECTIDKTKRSLTIKPRLFENPYKEFGDFTFQLP